MESLFNNEKIREFPGKYRCISATVLKLVAMLLMLADHVGAVLFPGIRVLRIIGRLSMPVFAFCVAEGVAHTHSLRRYILRLALFALISELPFDLALFGALETGHQNIMFTFMLAAIAVAVYEKLGAEDTAAYRLASVAAVVAIGIVSKVFRTDYSYYAIGLVFIFYLTREHTPLERNASGAAWQLLIQGAGIQACSAFSALPLLFYSGKRGRGLKWLFYVFYPGHLLLLYLIKRCIAV